MADANLFARFAQPVRSVADYLDQYDQQDARKADLAARQQQNAIQAAALRRQTEADGIASTERNALRSIAQQYGNDESVYVKALRGSGMPGLMTQADAIEAAGLKRRDTQSQIDERTSQGAKRQQEMSKAQREAAATQIASLNSPDEALALLKAKIAAKEVPPELEPAFTSLIRTDPKWQIKLALSVGSPEKLVEVLKPHIQYISNGKVQTPVDTNALSNPNGQKPIVMTTTPGEDQSSADRRAGIAAENARSVASRAQSDRHFNARMEADRVKDAAAGAGGQKPAAQPTESERTAGFLLQRLRDSQRQLSQATAGAPDAAKPGLLQEGVRLVSEPAANAVTGEARQRVEAAQLDILDAALTLGTGAAYTREQIQGYRKSYFPQIGDKPAAMKEKAERLNNLIRAAETKAGRASADTAPMKPAVQALPKPSVSNW